MRVEAALVEQSIGDVKAGGIRGEAQTWGQLFSKKYRPRTLIGVLMMVFQRRYRRVIPLRFAQLLMFEQNGVASMRYCTMDQR